MISLEQIEILRLHRKEREMAITTNFNKEVEEHMSIQPHSVCCAECGRPLEIRCRNVDADMDVYIEVEPCVCTKKEG